MKPNFNPVYLLIFLFLLSSKSFAQKDTIYFDKDWQIVSKGNALYYRIKPSKIKTKDAIGYKIKNIDSLFVINDYYIKNNELQFKGHSKDYNADYLVGKVEWFNENGNKIDTNDFSYKNINNSKFKIPESSILYIDYKVANKSLFTAGLEICLDCKNNDEDRYFLGLGYGITNSYDGKYYSLPDLHLSYNWTLFYLKGGISNRHAYALAGISAFNLIDLGFGYSQSFNNNRTPYIQGFTFGATIRLAKNPSAYQKMKIM